MWRVRKKDWLKENSRFAWSILVDEVPFTEMRNPEEADFRKSEWKDDEFKFEHTKFEWLEDTVPKFLANAIRQEKEIKGI